MWLGSITHQITSNILWMDISLKKKCLAQLLGCLPIKAKGLEASSTIIFY